MKRIVSWNVNGIRAVAGKGFLEWMLAASADVVCVQETKASPGQLGEELLDVDGYRSYWATAVRKGYSGVGVYTRETPREVASMGIERFDAEGRVLQLEFPGFVLINAYFPNSQDGGRRLDYKLDFCSEIARLCDEHTRAGRPLLVCGDFNVAHRPIDLARPEENEKSPGYLPEERAWMDGFIGTGYVDSFRMYCSEGGRYTWWSYLTRGRERNIGWRIDYHCVNAVLAPSVREAAILDQVYGSDHCPVGIAFDLPGETV